MVFTSVFTFVRFPGFRWWHGRGKLVIKVLLFAFSKRGHIICEKSKWWNLNFSISVTFCSVVQKQLQFTSYIWSDEVVVKLVWENVCYHQTLGVKAKSKVNAYNLELQPCTILSLVCCIFWENNFNQAACLFFHQNPSLRKKKRKSFEADAEEEGDNQGLCLPVGWSVWLSVFLSVPLSIYLFVCGLVGRSVSLSVCLYICLSSFLHWAKDYLRSVRFLKPFVCLFVFGKLEQIFWQFVLPVLSFH